jgi:hypothetical protein
VKLARYYSRAATILGLPMHLCLYSRGKELAVRGLENDTLNRSTWNSGTSRRNVLTLGKQEVKVAGLCKCVVRCRETIVIVRYSVLCLRITSRPQAQ